MLNMNRNLDSTQALRWLEPLLRKSRWQHAGTVLAGTFGEWQTEARCHANGLTIALQLDRPAQQALGAAQVLAATPEARDDGIYLADGQLWLVRRYPEPLTEVELDLLFKQQRALAALLVVRRTMTQDPPPLRGGFV